MSSKYPCLPSNVKEADVAKYKVVDKQGANTIEKVTVKQELDRIGATCKSGKLVDCNGREIKFFQMQGCWGNPPADYLEILEKQKEDLERLKKDFTVIEMTCETAGVPLQSIS